MDNYNKAMPMRRKRGGGRKLRPNKYNSGWLKKTLSNPNTYRIAAKAYGLASWAAGFLNTEFKSYDVLQSNVSIDTNGAFYTLNNPAQGDDATERIGRQIRNKSLDMKLDYRLDQGQSNVDIVRTIIIKDTKPEVDSGAITIADVLSSSQYFAQKPFTARNRFIFLKDFNVHLSAERPTASRKIYMKLNDHSVWDGSSNFVKGKYYVFFVSWHGQERFDYATNVDMSTRWRYVDN